MFCIIDNFKLLSITQILRLDIYKDMYASVAELFLKSPLSIIPNFKNWSATDAEYLNWPDRFFRQLSVDEIPSLLIILKGEIIVSVAKFFGRRIKSSKCAIDRKKILPSYAS